MPGHYGKAKSAGPKKNMKQMKKVAATKPVTRPTPPKKRAR